MAPADQSPSERVHLHADELEEMRHHVVELQRNDLACRVVLGLAHDINNLLHIVNSSADLMQMYLKDHPTAPRDLERISGASRRASSMLRRTLDVLRREPEGRRRISLCRVVTEIQGLLVGLCGARITVTSKLDTEGGYILTDRVEMDQVLLNLAINARDAMPDGGKLNLRVHAGPCPGRESTERCVILDVEDTGQGMSTEVQQNIFAPFFTTKEQGTGLGLTVVKAIVADHKGWIEVSSSEGKGALIRLYFREAPVVDQATPVASGVGTD